MVKISSRMARTGKTGQSTNHYLIAANGLIMDHHNGPSNNIVVNEEEEEANSKTVGKTTRIRGVSTGTTKLVSIERHLYIQFKVSGEYQKVKDMPTVETLTAATYEEPKTNAKTRMRSTGYFLPLFNGYIKYKSLCNKKRTRAQQRVQFN